ncbi:IgGFc-binding protein-like [Ambystoma mexicanum]|uniref:IgGFc-binding protein-like n=1 Tax=Ambystoma mexicanum TaxID=8296 RepID=UPI0037E97D7D
MVKAVKNGQGSLGYDAPHIGEAFRQYYEKLYASEYDGGDAQIEDFLSSIQVPALTREMSQRLEGPVTEEEIDRVINGMKVGTSPGEDGFTVYFYKRFHSTLAPHLARVFNSVLEGGILPESMMGAIIAVMPKEALACPDNSHYEQCGVSCPATCYSFSTPVVCSLACSEGCYCDSGFIHSGDECAPIKGCGCVYKGRYYKQTEEFFVDKLCQQKCKCQANGIVTCQIIAPCGPKTECKVMDGIQGCFPVPSVTTPGTCVGSGDPHYTTFDGFKFDFMGTCIYQLAGLCSSDSTLTPFNVKVLNNNRGNSAVSYTKTVTLEVYNLQITLSKDAPFKMQVNAVFVRLPYYYQKSKISAFVSGLSCVIKVDFGLAVTFDWNSLVRVTLPGSYSSAVCGLCGNFNQNAKDDLTMKSGGTAPNAVKFGESWKVGTVPGCTSDCVGNCLLCSEAEAEPYKGDNYCGVIIRANGPFSSCHRTIDPTPFFSDCVFDTCQYKGLTSALCSTIAAYATACQGQGIQIQNWRTSSFCNMECPLNSHYELCGTSCSVYCYNLSSAVGCDAGCSEGCFCDTGYILSGDLCVSASNCGCVYQDAYLQKGDVFYTAGCLQQCKCSGNGQVSCSNSPCSDQEECKIVDGILGCYPNAFGRCIAAGDPHYLSFDGQKFDFQGTCSYTLAKVCPGVKGLVNFEVVVDNESFGKGDVAVTDKVTIYVYNRTIEIENRSSWQVKVDNEMYILPLILEGEGIWINQEGINIVVYTDFGLTVLYDAQYYAQVEVPSTYSGHMCGLCGNFNDDERDDFMLPSGQVVKSVDDFGTSWKKNESNIQCTNGCGTSCPTCSAVIIANYITLDQCGKIRDPNGPFKQCLPIVIPTNFLSFCAYDMCAVNGDQDILCKSLQAYTTACQNVGINIQPWRTDTFCPIQCPAGSTYSSCANNCENTCASLFGRPTCSSKCYEGCVCNPGLLFDGVNCVPMNKCGCRYKGRYIQFGSFILTADCSRKCVCQPLSNTVLCVDFKCSGAATCGMRLGIRGCYNNAGQCSVDVPKNSGGFGIGIGIGNNQQRDGVYGLVSACDVNSKNWFAVVLVYNRPFLPILPSVESLYVFFQQTFVSVTTTNILNFLQIFRPRVVTTVTNTLSVTTSVDTIVIRFANGASMKLVLGGDGKVDITSVSDSLVPSLCGLCGDFSNTLLNDNELKRTKSTNSIDQVIALVRSNKISSWAAKLFSLKS